MLALDLGNCSASTMQCTAPQIEQGATQPGVGQAAPPPQEWVLTKAQIQVTPLFLSAHAGALGWTLTHHSDTPTLFALTHQHLCSETHSMGALTHQRCVN